MILLLALFTSSSMEFLYTHRAPSGGSSDQIVKALIVYPRQSAGSFSLVNHTANILTTLCS